MAEAAREMVVVVWMVDVGVRVERAGTRSLVRTAVLAEPMVGVVVEQLAASVVTEGQAEVMVAVPRNHRHGLSSCRAQLHTRMG